MGLVRGFLAPFRGGAFIARHRLWHYLVLPVLLDVALGVDGMVLASRYWRAEAFVGEQLIKAPAVGWLILVVLTVVSGAVLFLVAQPLLQAVFSDRLSDGWSARSAARRRPLRCWPLPGAPSRTACSSWSSTRWRCWPPSCSASGPPGSAPSWAWRWPGSSSPTTGSITRSPVGAPASARSGATCSRTRRRRLGSALGATLLYLVPLALFVAPPFVAAGATMVFVESEGEAEVKEPRKRGEEKGAAAEASKGAGQAQV